MKKPKVRTIDDGAIEVMVRGDRYLRFGINDMGQRCAGDEWYIEEMEDGMIRYHEVFRKLEEGRARKLVKWLNKIVKSAATRSNRLAWSNNEWRKSGRTQRIRFPREANETRIGDSLESRKAPAIFESTDPRYALKLFLARSRQSPGRVNLHVYHNPKRQHRFYAVEGKHLAEQLRRLADEAERFTEEFTTPV